MTLPSSGQIAMSDINVEHGVAATTGTDWNWVKNNTKGNPNDFNSMHGLAWFQRNQDGNCNNGNCAGANCGQCSSAANCVCTNVSQCNGACTIPVVNCATNPASFIVHAIVGNCLTYTCAACYSYTCINCTNCDGQSYFQGNCNCACTYNCNIAGYTWQ